jgi:flavin-dependent dehydrogenase
MSDRVDVDVAVVGGSLAGCAAARMYAQRGLRVALIEKHSEPDAYKRLCGHFIQASAVPVFERLGLAGALEAAGAVKNGADLNTQWGWIRARPGDGEQTVHGYSIRRSRLDPMIRTLARETDGVSYIAGGKAAALIEDGGTVRGVAVRDRAGRETLFHGRLVVGADGRNSTIAGLAQARERRSRNNRFCYMAYYEGIHLDQDRAHGWIDGPDVLFLSPNEDGITLVAEFPHKQRLQAFKRDRERAFDDYLREMAGERLLGAARRVSKHVGYTDYAPIVRRAVPRKGVALIGDAAITCDPLLAIGCGFALQSAEWLVDSTTPALEGEETLARGLRRYRRTHRSKLMGHVRMLNAGALAKPPNPIERLIFSAAAKDAPTARHLESFLVRKIPVRKFLGPRALARAAAANLGRVTST